MVQLDVLSCQRPTLKINLPWLRRNALLKLGVIFSSESIAKKTLVDAEVKDDLLLAMDRSWFESFFGWRVVFALLGYF